MAGVYIKGARLPDSCVDCFMRKECFGHREEIAFLEFIHGRSRDCPLVEVPDHGDLIEAHSLKIRLGQRFCLDDRRVMEIVRETVDTANVVIPADKEEV